MKQVNLFEVLAMLKDGVETDDLIREISLEGEVVSDEDTIDYLSHVGLFLEDYNNTSYDNELEYHVSFFT